MKVYITKNAYLIEMPHGWYLVEPWSDGSTKLLTPEMMSEQGERVELTDTQAANALWDRRHGIYNAMHDEDLPVFTKWLHENVTLNNKMYNSVGGHDAGHGRRPGAMRLNEYIEQSIIEHIRQGYMSKWTDEALDRAQDRAQDETDWQRIADEAVDKLLNLYVDELGERVVDNAVDRICDEYVVDSDTLCEDFTLDSLYEVLDNDGVVDDVAYDVGQLWPNMREVLI